MRKRDEIISNYVIFDQSAKAFRLSINCISFYDFFFFVFCIIVK